MCWVSKAARQDVSGTAGLPSEVENGRAPEGASLLTDILRMNWGCVEPPRKDGSLV